HRPPRPTLFPYTTLFRSEMECHAESNQKNGRRRDVGRAKSASRDPLDEERRVSERLRLEESPREADVLEREEDRDGARDRRALALSTRTLPCANRRERNAVQRAPDDEVPR